MMPRMKQALQQCMKTALPCLLLCLGLSTTGCASLPEPQPQPPAAALQPRDGQATRLGRIVGQAAKAQGESGFRLLVSGEDAMGALIALADHAQRTLDLQYYIIRKDDSSRAIMRHVRAAADRGVKVRLLIDDLNTAGEDAGLLRLTRHPNIDVRLYNPLPGGRLSTMSRIMASLTDISRINHRMHNKMFVADNVLAVTGGRNLGDAYFLRDKESNFLDIDVLVAGPAVHALSATFDRFWNDKLAYPVAAIADESAKAESLAAPASKVDTERHTKPDTKPDTKPAQHADQQAAVNASSEAERPAGTAAATKATPASPGPATSTLSRELDQGRLSLQWVPAKVMADKPTKLVKKGGESLPAHDEVIYDDVDRLLLSAHKQLYIVSPYFVPGPHGLALFGTLRQRGVDVRVLTNSLAATDAPAVHAGYARYREPLLKMGVRIHELKASLKNLERRKRVGGPWGSSRASLHAKVVVIDGRVALVGSMNLDPRSRQLNSEMGVVMHSPEIARQLIEVYEEVASQSYALSLSGDDDLVWHSDPPDPALQGVSEPGASLWLKLLLKLIGPFAPDEML